MEALIQDELSQLGGQLDALEQQLTLALLPSDPRDERSVMLEIRAGTGGDEAALWAGDLARMYERFAQAVGWSVQPLSASESDLGGFKELILAIRGDGVYSQLKYEAGVHRVQRVPATESQGRVHTSTATVAVKAETGEVVWSRQLVHHDIWDVDTNSAPTLVDIKKDGKVIPALIQATKMGFLFVLNRNTGEPVWPIEERPVPKGDVPDEWYSPTQPFPLKPARSFGRVEFNKERDMVRPEDTSPQHVAECHSRQHDVVDVLAATTQQAWIFETGYRLTDCKLAHCSPRT
jgi:hypothetical protein